MSWLRPAGSWSRTIFPFIEAENLIEEAKRMKFETPLHVGAPNIGDQSAFYAYVQYESVRHIHRGPDREWSHTGTNGFTARQEKSGTD